MAIQQPHEHWPTFTPPHWPDFTPPLTYPALCRLGAIDPADQRSLGESHRAVQLDAIGGRGCALPHWRRVSCVGAPAEPKCGVALARAAGCGAPLLGDCSTSICRNGNAIEVAVRFQLRTFENVLTQSDLPGAQARRDEGPKSSRGAVDGTSGGRHVQAQPLRADRSESGRRKRHYNGHYTAHFA